MTAHVQHMRLAVYDGTNSAELLAFLDGAGEPGSVWTVASETDGVVGLESHVGTDRRLELSLTVGEAVARQTMQDAEWVLGPWPATNRATGLAEVPTAAEFTALAARVTALESA